MGQILGLLIAILHVHLAWWRRRGNRNLKRGMTAPLRVSPLRRRHHLLHPLFHLLGRHIFHVR